MFVGQFIDTPLYVAEVQIESLDLEHAVLFKL